MENKEKHSRWKLFLLVLLPIAVIGLLIYIIIAKYDNIKFDDVKINDLLPPGIGSARDQDPFNDQILERKQKDGRDNAMIYYHKASYLLPSSSDQETELVKKVLDEGWESGGESLKPFLDAFQPAFVEVRKGAALDYAKNVEPTDFSTPIPNFISAQRMSRMLCAEGRLFESQGRIEDALQNYLTVLTMGRDYGSENAILIGGLISMAVKSVALRQINRLVTSWEIKDAKLLTDVLLPRLKAIENTSEPIVNAFKAEKKMLAGAINTYRKNPSKFKKDNETEFSDIKMTDQLLNDWEKGTVQYYDVILIYYEQPYHKRDFSELLKKTDECRASLPEYILKLIENAVPDFESVDVRYHVVTSRLRETQIATALEIFRLTEGRYPANLSELVPKYFDELPMDVFTGKPYIFKPSSNFLYGLGPDQTDDSGAIFYDPTNGAKSAGDLM